VVPIHIPPLRERRDDIHPLILSVVSKINDNYEWVKILSNEALNTLFEYHWPGNVRELENLVERVMVSVPKDIIGKEDLPELQVGEDNDRIIAVGDYQEALARHDYMLIKNVISQEGSIPKAAKVLGVDVTTVRRKLRKFEKLTL
jgi:transcriptional regulator with PAS, ATPase and Fis domain